ncbi:MAG: Rpn family recombination-promoting nuclease/putative transposase [Lachnospiraceae bacterium]|nr:Rpn family recombination-promoting nuclease/putative transposase [Lachnospiraceae bacterium]
MAKLKLRTDKLKLAEELKWDNLGIGSDYIFGKVMLDKWLCLELIRLILPYMEIIDISMPESQKSLRPDMDAHGVRFDVYVRDANGVVYDIEMEIRFSRHLPKRMRYYGSMIDMTLLDKGVKYKNLKPRVIIFICPFDLFGKGLHKYTFKNICVEDNSLEMGDETVNIFLNAKGVADDVSPRLKAFLDLVIGKHSDDEYVKKVEAAVGEAKKNREWRKEYMTLMMRDEEMVEKGMRKMALKLRSEGVALDVIARAAGEDEETIQEWLEEDEE